MKERTLSRHFSRSSRWLFLTLGIATVSATIGLPAAARAAGAEAAEMDYFAGLKKAWDLGGKAGGYVSSMKQGYDSGVKFLQWAGMLQSPVTADQIYAEMLRIAAYQDKQTKQQYIATGSAHWATALDQIVRHVELDSEGQPYINYDSAFDASAAANAETSIITAVNELLAPNNACTNLFIYQNPAQAAGGFGDEEYDWRLGLGEAVQAVAADLLLTQLLYPNFQTDPLFDTKFKPQFEAIRGCLAKHRDLIMPPRPATMCRPAVGCGAYAGCGCGGYQCQEPRSWPSWHVEEQSVPGAFCMSYAQEEGSYESHIEFEEAHAKAMAAIVRENLPVLVGLQRMIDILDIIINKRSDLTAANHHIPFGANPQLCLAQVDGGQTVSLEDCSAGGHVNWEYHRDTGRIENLATGMCVAASDNPPSSLVMAPCTSEKRIEELLAANESLDDLDESQIWDWLPGSGLIKNPRGAVISVTDAAPTVGSAVTAELEHSWRLHQQVWTDGTVSSCVSAVCPLLGPEAWMQGPIAETQQRYPRDFSIFAFLSVLSTDPHNSLRDVRGPIAANGAVYATEASVYPGYLGGKVELSSFAINGWANMPIGLLQGGGRLMLTNGRVFGAAYLDPSVTQSATNVTYVDADSATIKPNPINFPMTFVRLQRFSASLAQMASTGAANVEYGTNLVFTSSAPEQAVQVFNVESSAFSNVYSVQFVNVPSAATVVINVSGRSARIADAGFSGLPSPERVLWNFHEAKGRVIATSVTIPGSILAPYASAVLSYGAVDGTVAAFMVNATSEFHWHPFDSSALVANSNTGTATSPLN